MVQAIKSLSIVVPSYNEKDNAPILVEKLEEALRGIDYEIIFVDDSTDDTPRILEALAKEHPRVRYRHRDSEKGLATAVLLGFSLAEGQLLAVMDADLQHPPEILRSMFAVLQDGADICIPSRLIPGGSDGGLNFYRKFVSGTARNIGKLFLPCLRHISDPTSGLFMFRREMIAGADLRPIGWKIMVEVLAMGRYRQVVEIPYAFQTRSFGASKMSLKVTLEYLWQCLELRLRSPKHPGLTVQVLTTAQTEEKVRLLPSPERD